MKLSIILSEIGKPFSYYPGITRLVDDTDAGILLCYLIWCTPDPEDRPEADGWFYRKAERIERETGQSRARQAAARKTLTDLNLIKSEMRGSPPVMWFRVAMDELNQLWEQREELFAKRAARTAARTAKARSAKAAKYKQSNAPSDGKTEPVQPSVAQNIEPSVPQNIQPSVPQNNIVLSDRDSTVCSTEGSLINIENNKKRSCISPRTKRDGEKRNEFYDIFAQAFQAKRGMPYQPQAPDFIQLAKLRKVLGDNLTIEAWTRAVTNYLASERGVYTLRDLVPRFADYHANALDRFNRPMAIQPQHQQNGDSNNGTVSSFKAAVVI
jgi:hypothetical protein